ncbi:MAG: hypothetical protein VKK62_11555 [Synechococcaceae cyanobacterium]|nr:hypothetical protein [Synechococcaceae cyanobacterium]
MKPLRGIPSSRAYWELKAEQMMNRVFDPERTIDLEPEAAADTPSPRLSKVSGAAPTPRAAAPTPGSSRHPTGAAPAPVAARRSPPRPSSRSQAGPAGRLSTVATTSPQRFDRQLLLIASLGGVCLVSALCSVLFLNHTWKVQENLREERNLLLVERLRSLGPASPASQPVAPPAQMQTMASASSPQADLPPPPDEPWMEQLGSLPQSEANPAPVLRVPVSPRLAAAAPPASTRPSRSEASAPAPPQLVGLVGAQGRAGSAIFQVGSSSTTVSVGESIGASGWRLQSTQGDSAVIERNGVVRQLSMNNGS